MFLKLVFMKSCLPVYTVPPRTPRCFATEYIVSAFQWIWIRNSLSHLLYNLYLLLNIDVSQSVVRGILTWFLYLEKFDSGFSVLLYGLRFLCLFFSLGQVESVLFTYMEQLSGHSVSHVSRNMGLSFSKRARGYRPCLYSLWAKWHGLEHCQVRSFGISSAWLKWTVHATSHKESQIHK